MEKSPARKKVAKRKAESSNSAIAKFIRIGVGALWMTEESVRKAIQDLSLPKDATAYLIDQIDRRKNEIISVIRQEVHLAIQKMDIGEVVNKIVQNHDMEIDATIRFKPKK